MITPSELESRFHALYASLSEAGNVLRAYHRNKQYSIKRKADGSRVTSADIEMSDFWKELLHRLFPGEFIVSEEDENTHSFSDRPEIIWYVDPIDGTSKFINGSPYYYVLISMCVNGLPVFGIMYQPEKEETLFGCTNLKTRLYNAKGGFQEIHPQNSWIQEHPILVKGMDSGLRHTISSYTERPVKRSYTEKHHITQALSPGVCGFISYRPTAYWDLAAPAAIMHSAGYQTGIIQGKQQASYNSIPVRSDRFYCLPMDTPEHVISYISQM
ncbi:inositol monophosphatase family protein [Balneolaceae bacterium ANBcel3]|nr:inositol monophosphatase family protein [Balneolaceae bacterium ANBcel3]